MFRLRRMLPFAALIAVLALLAPDGVLGQAAGSGEVVFRADSLQIQGSAISPDGRWIVFAARPDWGQSNLFAVPADGGEPVRLTRGRFTDGGPVWAQDGRSIVFHSNRVAGADVWPGHLMKLPFDPDAGRAAGIPRPVSMVPAAGPVAVSPNGTQLVFRGNPAGDDGPDWSLVVTPLEGGRPRVLTQGTPQTAAVGWDVTGEHVYFARNRPGGGGHLLYQIGLDGRGETALPDRSPAGMFLLEISTDGTRFLWGKGQFPACRRGALGKCSSFAMLDAEGREIGSIDGGLSPVVFSKNGTFLRAEVQQVAEVVIAPIAGGQVSKVRAPGEGGLLLGWTRAGELLFATGERADPSYFLWNPGNGRRARVQLPDVSDAIPPRIHPDGRHVLYSTAQPGGELSNLVIHDLETGNDRVVSTRLPHDSRNWGTRVYGRGGHPMVDDGRFVFLEVGPERTPAVRAVAPDGPVQTLAEGTSGLVAVHGERVAWVDRSGDEYELRLFDGRNGTSRTLARSETDLGPKLFWSNDGRTLVLLYPGSGPGAAGYDLAFIRPDDPDATLAVRHTDWKYLYALNWTPDDALLVLTAEGASSGAYMDVWITDPWSEAPLVPLVSDGRVWLGGNEVSPDGRDVAFPLWRTTGSALVRYEMDPPKSGSGGRTIRR